MTDIKNIKTKTVKSTLSLFFNSGYSAFLGLIANLILTIILSPKIFGVYITLLSTISFLNYFSDIGLAASLIQKKEIDDDDVKTVFTSQQIIILTLIALGFAFGPQITKFYNLPIDGLYLYFSLLISFFISSLKTIPSVFLERKIEYQKIVLVQVIESTFFYLLVIIFALLNFQLKSFIIAVIFRSIIGLLLIYFLSPWQPKIGFNLKKFKQLVSFGLPFQASSFLALFKDDLIILYLGKAIGFEGVGYIGWAKKWAEAPIRIIMDNINKVLFPTISRIQQEKQKVGLVLEKIIFYQTLILALIMGLSLIIMPKVVYLLPKYTKWVPALPLFNIFVISSFLVIFYAPFINVFNALGKVKISFSFMLFWTVLMWLLTPFLTFKLKLYGFPITHLLISLTFPLVIINIKKIVPIKLTKSIIPPIVSGIIGFSVNFLFIDKLLIAQNLILTIAINFLTTSLIYYFFINFIFKINLINELKYLLKNE